MSKFSKKISIALVMLVWCLFCSNKSNAMFIKAHKSKNTQIINNNLIKNLFLRRNCSTEHKKLGMSSKMIFGIFTGTFAVDAWIRYKFFVHMKERDAIYLELNKLLD